MQHDGRCTWADDWRGRCCGVDVMSGHTEGPWFAVRNSAFWEIQPDRAGEDGVPWSVGDVCSSAHNDADGGLQEANARLIAAAPDLLEALTMGAEINTPDLMDLIADRLVHVYNENPNICFVASLRNRAAAASAAIAKARGES